MNGVIYVAYGDPARAEAAQSIASLRLIDSHIPISLVGDQPVLGATLIHQKRQDAGGRWAKLNLDLLSPYDQTLYLDADTRIRADVRAGYRMLGDGWDLVLAYSKRQAGDLLGNVDADDKHHTLMTLGTVDVLGLQAGVMFWRKSQVICDLFTVWREEWAKYRTMDQGALLRALHRVQPRVWILGPAWNGGAVIEHLFGRARQ